MRRKQLSFSVTAILLSLIAFSQPNVEKKTSANELNAFYNQHIDKSANLYSGPSYVPQRYPMNGSPFYAGDSLRSGWIIYDGQFYSNVLLQWDVFQNYVITDGLVGNAKLILRNELIDSFYFAGHLVKFMPQDRKHNLMEEGFYDILYSGPTSLIVRRKKMVDGKIEDMRVVYHFLDKNRYYIKKNGLYYLVSNKKDIFNLFPRNRAGIRREARQNRLRWKKDLEQVLLIAVAHYDKANTAK